MEDLRRADRYLDNSTPSNDRPVCLSKELTIHPLSDQSLRDHSRL